MTHPYKTQARASGRQKFAKYAEGGAIPTPGEERFQGIPYSDAPTHIPTKNLQAPKIESGKLAQIRAGYSPVTGGRLPAPETAPVHRGPGAQKVMKPKQPKAQSKKELKEQVEAQYYADQDAAAAEEDE